MRQVDMMSNVVDSRNCIHVRERNSPFISSTYMALYWKLGWRVNYLLTRSWTLEAWLLKELHVFAN